MPVPTAITDLSTVAADNFPKGNESVGNNPDNYIRAHAAFIAQLNEKTSDVISVKDSAYGAVGDGVTDDTTAIQAALTDLGSNRGSHIYFPSGKYLITAPLVFKPDTLPAALTGSDLHFSDHVEAVIYGKGDARIIAGAAMSRMLLIQYNSTTSSIAPFYTTITGIMFDGANLATRAIEADYAAHVSILKNKIRRVATGIKLIGYGIARIRDNVIKATTCIDFGEGGGDSEISTNDFYPLTNGKAVYFGKLCGNTVVDSNTISGEGETNVLGVQIDGTAFLSTDTIRDVRVTNNEFSGMLTAVYAQRHSGGRNVYGILVEGNHVTPSSGGAVHTGALVSFNGVDDATVMGNRINGLSQTMTLTTDPGVQLVDCARPLVYANKFGNLLGPAMYLTTTTNGKFSDNEIDDVGTSSSGAAMIDVDTGCSGNTFKDNRMRQSSASYAQNSIIERSGANSNEFLCNSISGANRVSKSGAASVVSGRVVASGAYTVSGGVASLYLNSSGFTVTRTAAGTCTVTFATARPTTHYIVKTSSDQPQTAIESKAVGSFVVKSYNAAGTLTDPLLVHVEVTD